MGIVHSSRKHNDSDPKSDVFLLDCIEGMKQYPDKYFDLAVVDPPYGLERFKNGGSRINKYGAKSELWNSKKPSQDYWAELFRCSKYQIVWGGNNFNLPTSEYFIIWHKDNAMDFSFAMCEYAWTNYKKPAKIVKILRNTIRSEGQRIHPTQKPIKLYDWIYANYAKEGNRILDTHLGSGSSRIAADKAGLDFTGFEVDEKYFNLANKRFDYYKIQGKLF
jgi:site-specific DNA-methyltransferase (adenine-specific)